MNIDNETKTMARLCSRIKKKIMYIYSSNSCRNVKELDIDNECSITLLKFLYSCCCRKDQCNLTCHHYFQYLGLVFHRDQLKLPPHLRDGHIPVRHPVPTPLSVTLPTYITSEHNPLRKIQDNSLTHNAF